MQIKEYSINGSLSNRIITKNNIKSKTIFCTLTKNAYFCTIKIE